MRLGLLFAIVMHAAVLLLAAFYVVRVMPMPLPIDDIPVDVVDIAPVTNIKAQAPKVDKPEEKPAPEVAPPPPEAAPPEPPSNQAILTPEAKPEPKKAEPPKPQEKPKPAPEEKPKDEHFDPNSIQALLDKAKKQQKKEQKTAEAPASGSSNDEPRAKVGEGTDNKADVTDLLINAMKRQVGACWSFPAGAVQPEDLVVWIDIQLRPDGNLTGAPQIEEQSRMGEPYFRAAAEAAVRAINRCQPYELPAEHFDAWREMRLSFDPRHMVGQ